MKKLAPIIRLSESLNKESLPIIGIKNREIEIIEEKIQGLENLIENKNSTIAYNNKIIENPFEDIFSNSKSFLLFEKLHNSYKTKKNRFLANYSFIFYAMKSDGFLICSGTKFIDFLNDNFEITIPKIDNRQVGKNEKTSTYNAYKESVFKLQ